MENRVSVALRRARSRPDFINLIDTNFHSCGLAPDRDAIERAYRTYLHDEGLRPYQPEPAGLARLREAVARFYERSGVTVQPDSVVVTASASESYGHVFAAVCERGGVVLLPRPGYPLFEEVALRLGLVPRFYDLHYERGWQISAEEIEAAIGDGTAAVVVISPNNPTGSIADRDALRRIGDRCAAVRVPLIVDEVFSEFRFTAGELPRPATISPATLVFTINGASKLLASPDLKVSWIATTGPSDIVNETRELLEIENDLYLNSSPINQFVAASLLEAESASQTSLSSRLVAEVARRRAVMLEELQRIAERHPGRIEWTEPDGGIHLPVLLPGTGADVDANENAGAHASGGPDDEEIAVRLLDEYALAVHPGYLYGVEGRNLIVVSYLSRPETIRSGLARLDEFLTRLRTS
ncbi:MAG: pyridoxal phosphate-dependent aminotransferase [Spirochaetales bacterium]